MRANSPPLLTYQVTQAIYSHMYRLGYNFPRPTDLAVFIPYFLTYSFISGSSILGKVPNCTGAGDHFP